MLRKIRLSVAILSGGLVTALIWAVASGQGELVSVLSVALVGSLTKLVESEEKTSGG